MKKTGIAIVKGKTFVTYEVFGKPIGFCWRYPFVHFPPF